RPDPPPRARAGTAAARTAGCCPTTRRTRRCSAAGSGSPPSWRACSPGRGSSWSPAPRAPARPRCCGPAWCPRWPAACRCPGRRAGPSSAALAGAGLAVRSARDDASRQRTAATSARLAGQSTTLQATDPVTASLLAGAAWRIAPTAQARYSLLESLAQPVRGILSARSGEVTAVASSPGGKTLAAAYRDGTIRLWDVSSHRLVSSATWGGAADALAFTGGGKTLEVAGPTAVGEWNLAGR